MSSNCWVSSDTWLVSWAVVLVVAVVGWSVAFTMRSASWASWSKFRAPADCVMTMWTLVGRHWKKSSLDKESPPFLSCYLTVAVCTTKFERVFGHQVLLLRSTPGYVIVLKQRCGCLLQPSVPLIEFLPVGVGGGLTVQWQTLEIMMRPHNRSLFKKLWSNK